MREIMFRVWNKTSKFMTEVDGEDLLVTNDGLFVRQSVAYYGDEIVRVEFEYELMQYTGLKDKNGVEIYEGDICQYTNSFGDTVDADGNDMKFSVEYKDGMFTLDDFMLCNYLIKECGKLEIIGNIHQNPELLEAK